MRVATHMALRTIPARKVVEIGTRIALMEQRIKDETMSHARSILHHPPLSSVGLYGLSAAIDLTLRRRPQVIGQWISKGQPAEINQTLLSHIARRLTFVHPEGPIHTQALRSRVPLLQAMAAESFVEEHPRHEPAKSIPELMELLQSAGLAGDAVFALAFVGAHATINWRCRARDAVIRATRQLEHIRRSSANIAERADYASERLEQLRNDLPTLRREQEAAELAADDLVTAMARLWPQNGLQEETVGILRSALGSDMPELATRVAQQITHTKAREELLQLVIENMSAYLGLSTPTAGFDSRFNPEFLDFPSLCHWTAKAYGLLYQNQSRGVGHHAAIALAPLAKASAKILDAPYAACRWPERYESALTRRACSVWFALCVAYGDSLEERKSRSRLMQIALEQAVMVLRRDRVDVDTKGWSFNLAYLAVRVAPRDSAQDPRTAWSQDLTLPAYARAFAIWSSLSLIQSSPADARSLFVETGLRGSTSLDPTRDFKLMLLLLDLAAANCIGGNATDVEQIILQAWPQAFNSWRKTIDCYFEHIHLKLLEAVSTDGPARQQLLADPAWAGSACLEAIREADGPE